MFDDRDFFVCGRCGHRIHRANVPNSISGQVICCGTAMRGPYDPAITITATLALLLVAGGILLLMRRGWGFWGAFVVCGGAVLFAWVPAGLKFFGWMDRRFWRK